MHMSNRLIHEKSPYLRQHADNPVDWYPWGEEAFEKARREDKPVFLSIGYSTCHWCHVMAHESFEDEAVTEAINRDFIPIKVDREERPNLTVLVKTPENAQKLGEIAPFTADYPIPASGARYYLCRGGACQSPADSIEALDGQMGRMP